MRWANIAKNFSRSADAAKNHFLRKSMSGCSWMMSWAWGESPNILLPSLRQCIQRAHYRSDRYRVRKEPSNLARCWSHCYKVQPHEPWRWGTYLNMAWKKRGKSVQQGKRLPEADFQVQMLWFCICWMCICEFWWSFSTLNFVKKASQLDFANHKTPQRPVLAEVRVALPVIPTRVETAATSASPLVSQRRESVKTEVKPFKHEIKDEGAEGAKTLEMQFMQWSEMESNGI